MKLTGSKWSHCFFLLGEVCGELSVMEADLKCQVVPWTREYVENNNDYYEVYRPVKASLKEIKNAGSFCFKEYSGEMYGFLQIPWFIYRILVHRLFGSNPKKNWSTSGVICSESLYDYLFQLGGKYRDLVKDLGPDITSPEDLYRLVLSRTDLFEFVGKRI